MLVPILVFAEVPRLNEWNESYLYFDMSNTKLVNEVNYLDSFSAIISANATNLKWLEANMEKVMEFDRRVTSFVDTGRFHLNRMMEIVDFWRSEGHVSNLEVIEKKTNERLATFGPAFAQISMGYGGLAKYVISIYPTLKMVNELSNEPVPKSANQRIKC